MPKNKAIFISESSQHLFIFKSIIKRLKGWNNIIICFHSLNDTNSNSSNIYYKQLNRNEKEILNFLIREGPSIVITAHDTTEITNLIINLANSLNIPSLMVQDGIYDFSKKLRDENFIKRLKNLLLLIKNLINFLFSNEMNFYEKINTLKFKIKNGRIINPVYGTGYSTKIAVFGKSTEEFLISLGVNSKKIIVTGSPKFDNTFKYETPSEFKKIKKIVVFTQPLVENNIWTIEQRKQFVICVWESISNLQDVNLTFKLHPFEKKEDYEKIFNVMPNNVEIVKNSSIQDIIKESDLAITLFSTVGLETIVMGKPLLIVNLFNDKIFDIYEDLGIIQVKQKEDISNIIRKILFNEEFSSNLLTKYQSSLKYHIYKMDGQSAERIASLIKDMCNQRTILC